MGVKRATNALPPASIEVARTLRLEGLSYRAIVRELRRQGLPGGLAAIHQACADLAEAEVADEGAEPLADAEERSLDLETLADQGQEVLERLLVHARAVVSGPPGDLEAKDLAKLLGAIGRETERCSKLARLHRGQPTVRTVREVAVRGKVEHQHTEAEQKAVGALTALRVLKKGG